MMNRFKMNDVDRKLYNALCDWLSEWEGPSQRYETPRHALNDVEELIGEWGEQWCRDEEDYMQRR